MKSVNNVEKQQFDKGFDNLQFLKKEIKAKKFKKLLENCCYREQSLAISIIFSPQRVISSTGTNYCETQSNNSMRGKALSSSLQLEPFADLFWHSVLHVRIFKLV